MTHNGRRTLLILAAICALPVIASYIAFYLVRPAQRMNYGELVKPTSLPRVALAGIDGRTISLDALRGRWVMVTVDQSRCDEKCRWKLYAMRQVRAAQGKEMARIERLWLLTDAGAPPGEVIEDFSGTVVLRASHELISTLPGTSEPRAHVWLVDPLGNVMLRYPENPDMKRMVKDIERLLKFSRVG